MADVIDEGAFRSQALAFLDANAKPRRDERQAWGEGSDRVALFSEKTPEQERAEVNEAKAWRIAFFDAGFGWITGPARYGGRELPASYERLWQGLQAGYDVPSGARFGIGLGMVAPTILAHGTDTAKDRYLRALYRAEIVACQLFSEPAAGSDLAGLQTAAVRDGDEWVINGQKTWTTLAQYADWIFVLARTDPAVKKQEGISFFLCDMKTPGVTVRPIQTIDGGYEVNEVFFDNVRIPAENIVGEVNKGWDYAKFLLSNERNGIARVGVSKARLAKVRRLASLTVYGDKPKMADPIFRMKLAAAEVELKALEMTQMRVIAASRGAAKGKPNPMSSVLKVKGSELQQTTTELLMDVVGPYALPYQPEQGDRWNEPSIGPDWASTIAPTYFNARKVSIYGGSNEIQRNIIAKAILGL
jgi:alkylation response protein AidB-like acyl-CoA dehydrogenase